MQTFLTAEWRNLILANYEVDPSFLLPYLPAHTELDLWQGRCYASLVGFMFCNTRVLGIKIPFHVNFEEVNLRFYVRHRAADGAWRRGVVFVKEIVPKPAITFVANTLYGESYQTLPMRHQWEEQEQLHVHYEWKYRGEWHRLAVAADKDTNEMAVGSEEEFIAEHYWGYAKMSDQKTVEYQVEHPRWLVHQVEHFEIEVDTGALYGDAFQHLTLQQPTSVFLAAGSEVSVRQGRKL